MANYPKIRKNSNPIIDGMKFCPGCKQKKPINEFYLRHGDREGELYNICKTCKNRRVTECAHESGRWRPFTEVKECSLYLGDIAERALSKFFDHIERMPRGNPGFDFRCGKGFKIDVKASCLRSLGQYPYWGFNIRRNLTPDYFLLLAFNNREDLDPQHVWLVPGSVVNSLMSLTIRDSPPTLDQWSNYEHPIGKVISCCASMR
jgi:hypothetical protein